MPESLLNGALSTSTELFGLKSDRRKILLALVVGSNGNMIATNFKKEGIQPAGELWASCIHF